MPNDSLLPAIAQDGYPPVSKALPGNVRSTYCHKSIGINTLRLSRLLETTQQLVTALNR